MQMASIDEYQDPAAEITEPEVRQGICEFADRGGHTEPPCGSAEEGETLQSEEWAESVGHAEGNDILIEDSKCKCGEAECKKSRKTVRFQDLALDNNIAEKDSSDENLFPDYGVEEWISTPFEELFMEENWEDITDDKLLRKKMLEHGDFTVPRPTWGQEVTVRMQCILDDRTLVEQDRKLVFIIGEEDVTWALEECAITMQMCEITLLLTDSHYAYGHLGREPDIPAWAPLLYQLQLLDIRDKPDPSTLSISDRIRVAKQKRELGNFHFLREDFIKAIRSYLRALDVLTTSNQDGGYNDMTAEDQEEVRYNKVKCLNNLAATQYRLQQYDEGMRTSQEALALEPNNIKALFWRGKLLAHKGEYEEAMRMLKRALKLEPSIKGIHIELSELVKKLAEGSETRQWKANPAQLLWKNIAPSGISWKFVLGALVVACVSLLVSVILTARN